MNLKKTLIGLVIVGALIAFCISKFSPLQEGVEALETAAQLIEENAKLKGKIAELEENFAKATASLNAANAQNKVLSHENVLLKEFSEERIRKFWSMYEPGS
jgi:phage shock protein A